MLSTLLKLVLCTYFMTITLSVAAYIDKVSIDPDFNSRRLTGSITGGTRLYIRGAGFDEANLSNQVFVGMYHCPVDNYYTSSSLLVCDLPAMFYGPHQNLQVVVRVNNEILECRGGDCSLDMELRFTPLLYSVYPQSVFAGEEISILGVWRSGKYSDMKRVNIGDRNCVRTETQTEEEDWLHYWSQSSFDCVVPEDLEVGDHLVSVVSSKGTGFDHPRRESFGFSVGTTTEKYNVRVHPKIEEISANSGFMGGQIIEVKGKGFGNDVTDLSVSVDDLNCHVLNVESTTNNEGEFEEIVDTITCELEAASSAFTNKLFKGGAGLRNVVYDGYDKKFDDYLNDAPGKTVLSDKTMLSTENRLNSSRYMQKAWGIFRPKTTGTHTFKIAGDDQTRLYLSKSKLDLAQPFDAASMLEQKCDIPRWTHFREFHKYPGQICQVELEAEEDYYMMAFQTEGGGRDSMTIAVETPNNGSDAENTKPQVQKVEILNDVVYQTMTVEVVGGQDGEFRLVFLRRREKDGRIDYYKVAMIPHDATDEYFCKKLRRAIGTYMSCSRAFIDSSGNEVAEASKAGYRWTVNFLDYRSKNVTPTFDQHKMTGSGISHKIAITQDQTPGITGNFKLKFQGHTTKTINYNDSWNSVKWKLEELPPLSGGVSVYHVGSSNVGRHWYVIFDSIQGNADPLEIEEDNISGGSSNISQKLVIHPNFEPATSNLVYLPIPSDFLRTVSDTPQLTVKVNGMLAGCEQDHCQYNLIDSVSTPKVTGFNLNEASGILSVNYQYNATESGRILENNDLSEKNISVSFGFAECQILTISNSSLTCELPKNKSGDLALENGNHFPKVHLNEKGFFGFESNVNAHSVNLEIDSISPSVGSFAGGTIITINGKGFAGVSNWRNTNSVLIDGKECIIKSFSTDQIKCETPASSNASTTTITVTANDAVATSNAFSYDLSITPTITELSPRDASPVLKTNLEISGRNFGTDAQKVSVMLVSTSNDDMTHVCHTTEVNDSLIKCRLGGGKTGEYSVRVFVDGIGYSMGDGDGSELFSLIVEVHSISPTSGSVAGGTVLTLTGKNFSTVTNENQVLLGDSGWNYCVVLTATSTELTCRVNQPREVPSKPVTVHVLARVQEQAVCTNQCQYEFDESVTPQITDISSDDNINGLFAKAGQKITISGNGFNKPADQTKVWLGDTEIDSFDIENSSTITFTMPELPFGSMPPKVRLDNQGDAQVKMSHSLENTLVMTSVSPTRASRYGGYVTITGNGFKPGHMTVYIEKAECAIKTISNTEILCRMPNYFTRDQAKPVSVVFNDDADVLQKISCPSCTYQTFDPSIRVWNKEKMDTSNLVKMEFDIRGNYFDTAKSDSSVTYKEDDVEVFFDPVDQERFRFFSVQGKVTEFGYRRAKVTFENVVAGKYDINFNNKSLGFAGLSKRVKNITIRPQVTAIQPISSSLAGGAILTISGTGFPENENKDYADVRVCGQKCETISSEYNQITCATPTLNTVEVMNQLNLLKPEVQRDAKVTADRNNRWRWNVMDGKIETAYRGRSDSDCFVKLDYGEDTKIRATKIRLFPRMHSNEKQLVGAVIEGSMNDVNYTTLATVEKSVIENWNVYKPNPDLNEIWEFRYLRFSGGVKYCQIAELEVTGYRFADLANFDIYSPYQCDVNLSVVGASLADPESNIVTYQMNMTPEVSSISPAMGPTSGNTVISISGNNFANDSEVVIDGVPCQVQTRSATSITCVTGPRPSFRESTFEVKSEKVGDAAIKDNLFLYIDRWSDPKTWGGEAPPRNGDSVHVPKGQTLLVDMSTEVLFAVVVEGVLIFADEQDMTFDAWFIMVQEGRLQIGSPEKPHMHNLTITLHGDRFSKMLPEFGNKGIFVHNGQLEIHGKPLSTTWTQLLSHGCQGDDQIRLITEPDWKSGDEIIIAPTGRDRNEVEERVIVDVQGAVVTLDRPLDHDHYAGVLSLDDLYKNETCASRGSSRVLQATNGMISDAENFQIRAEVGLLTRNVKIQGDESTMQTGHGVHIMVRGEKDVTSARYSFVEIFRAGQKFLLGKYPIHYHMMGSVHDMYVKGCAIHHTFNRGTTIHGSHYLHLFNNVYYRTVGHTIFLEDGIEENNIIENNLVVHVSPASSLLMSDMDPSGLWQARPRNFIRHNHFVGSAGNGAWFELVGKPTGPSSVFGRGICPLGEHLLQYDQNVHHSNSLGLRVYPIYIPKTDPCVSNFNGRLRDPYSHNPGMPALFKENIMYMNGLGTFGKKIGAVNYVDQVLISNGTNQNVAEPDNAKDSMARVVRGVSIGTSPLTNFHVNGENMPRFPTGKALGLGRKSGFLVKDTTYYNFNNGTILTTCGSCRNEKKRTPGGVRNNFENVRFVNVTSRLIQFNDPLYDKDILFDPTGSLVSQMNMTDAEKAKYADGVWITPWMEHLNIPECFKQTDRNVCSHDCAVCTNDIRLKTLKHKVTHNEKMFYGQDMKLLNMEINGASYSNQMGDDKEALFGINKFRNCQLSMNFRGWLSVIATGYTYNLHFGRGMDWKEMSTENNYYWGLEGAERSTYLRHNHTEHRELYDSFFYGLDENDEWREGSAKLEDVSVDGVNEVLGDGHNFGQFYYDAQNKEITWKIDERRMGYFETEGIYCRDNCPSDDVIPENSPIEQTTRRWSQAASWEELGRVPNKGEVVTIKKNWNMILDGETPEIEHLIIEGRLSFSPDFDMPIINAKLIEIKNGGELKAGTSDAPFTKPGKIHMIGNRLGPQVVLGQEIAPRDKAIVNKGKFHFYGNPPEQVWLRLAAKIDSGSSTLQVTDANHGWKVGDEIIIASSSTKHEEKELMTIASIDPNNNAIITTTSAFQYDHYGSEQTVTTEQGELDMRAEVGHLTRNLVVESSTEDDWGCNIITPSFATINGSIKGTNQGSLILRGVEIKKCGQRDTNKAAVDFNWLTKANQWHEVSRCSFNDGQGWAVNMYNSRGINLEENVFYNPRKYGVFMEKVTDVNIEGNLLIGVKERDNYDNKEYYDLLVGIYYNDSTRHWDRNRIYMKNNSVSSAPWFGYAVPGYNCKRTLNIENLNFYNNTAHSCRGGWIPTKLENQNCAEFSHFKAYKNDEQGFVQRADIDDIKVKHFILADNRNGLVINGGNGSKYPRIWFEDSVVIGKALIDAPELYEGDQCETSGMISGLFNKDPYDFYFEKTRLPMHNSTNVNFSFGGKQEVNRVVFRNFESPLGCENVGRSTAIRMNNFYQDNTNYITFKQCVVDNVKDADKFYFPDHKRHRDTPAYCGKRDCTGNYNTLFTDLDGAFFGKQMQFFGNNRGAGQDGDCTFFERWNGHACDPEYMQMLVTAGSNGQIFFPLTLSIEEYEEENLNPPFSHSTDSPKTVTNLIKKRETTRVQTAGLMPSGMAYQLFTQSSSDWVILKIVAEETSTMVVLTEDASGNSGKSEVSPIVVPPGQEMDLKPHVGTCGANHYHAPSRTLHVVVKGSNCKVTVEFAHALELSTLLYIDPRTFYDSDGVTTFIDRLAALLGISLDRIKVVGVDPGNSNQTTMLNTSIRSNTFLEDDSRNRSDVEAELAELQHKIDVAIKNGTVDFGVPVISTTSRVIMDETNLNDPVLGTFEDEEAQDKEEQNIDGKSNKTLTYVLIFMVVPILIGLVVLGVLIAWRRLKAKSSQQDVQGGDKIEDKRMETLDEKAERDVESKRFEAREKSSLVQNQVIVKGDQEKEGK